MANRFRGETTAILDGRERRIVFDYNALAEMETTLDCHFVYAFADVNRVGPREYRAALWAGLRSGGMKNLTLERAGELLGDNRAEAEAAVWAGLAALMSSNEVAKKGEEKADPVLTGTSSAA